MKSKLLFTTLIVLVLLNVILIFMVIQKPKGFKGKSENRNFLTEQLQFTTNQEKKFVELDQEHKESMRILDHKIRIQRDVLFNSFNNNSINIDSIIQLTSKIEIEKELEVYHFFKSVRKICNPEQKKKFDAIINKAIGGKRGPRERDHHPPPINSKMPPPKK